MRHKTFIKHNVPIYVGSPNFSDPMLNILTSLTWENLLKADIYSLGAVLYYCEFNKSILDTYIKNLDKYNNEGVINRSTYNYIKIYIKEKNVFKYTALINKYFKYEIHLNPKSILEDCSIYLESLLNSNPDLRVLSL